MTTTSPVRIGMPLDEFIKLYDTEGPFEIINGERINLMPTVLGHGSIVGRLFAWLYTFCVAGKLGIVYSESPFVLPDAYDANWVKGSRVPDIMFVLEERIARYYQEVPDWRLKPLILIPDLVIEVISPNDIYEEVDEKVEQYLTDGVKFVWVVNSRTRKIILHPAGSKQQTAFVVGDTLDAGDLIPGFRLALDDVFA